LETQKQFLEDLTRLLNVVSDTYDQYERDRKMIERSIDLSSDEMIGLNDALKKEKEELKKCMGNWIYFLKI
jgi:hypothetical protein